MQQLEAERASAEAHARQVDAILASMTEGIIIADPQGNVLQMNAVAAQIIGYNHPKEFQRPLTAFTDTFELHYIDGRLMSLEEWPLARVLQGETFTNFEVHVKRLDSGKELIVSYNGAPVRDEQGTMTLAMLTLRDITRQKDAEERLRKSEERFRLLCDNAPIGISISRDTSHVYVNQALANIFGYDNVEELLHQSLLALITLQCRKQILGYIGERKRGEDVPTEYETIGLRKDGSTFTLAVDVGRMPLADGIASITFMTDITERKEAE